MSEKYIFRWRGRFAFLIGLCAIGLLFGVFGVWGTQTKLAGAVIAPGLVKVKTNRQVVQHSTGGVVGAIYARNGDYVEAGEALLRLDNTVIRSELFIIDQQLVEAAARIARLRAERDGERSFKVDLTGLEYIQSNDIVLDQQKIFETRRSLLNNELSQLDEQILQTREQINGVHAQINSIRTQEYLYKKEIAPKQSLIQKGYLPRDTLFELQRNQARLQGEQGRLTALRGEHYSKVAALKLAKTRLKSTSREKSIIELRDLELDRVELLGSKITSSYKLSDMVVTAPVSGVVYGSSVFTLGAIIEKAKDLMYIIPQGEDLVISIRIPSSDVDQVTVGQKVSLRFTALDQRFTPEIFGVLNIVSADSFIDETTGKAYYEAEVSLLKLELEKLKEQPLVPGMPAEAYIRTAERSPLNYLTKPLADYFYRAFREG